METKRIPPVVLSAAAVIAIMASAIDAQSTPGWINAYRVVAPNVPFGGFGNSGIGRENGLHAVDEYLAEKAVWVELTGATRDPFVLG